MRLINGSQLSEKFNTFKWSEELKKFVKGRISIEITSLFQIFTISQSQDTYQKLL